MSQSVVPPTGTVSFLFTDIEGSTRLWQEQPEEMHDALARHDALLRQAIGDHRGYTFKTIGDAFCAAFTTPIDALTAALAVQRALHTEPWDVGTPISVRAALHTGVAQERDGDYFGTALSRVARMLAAAHGGQTLLSQAVHGLVCDGLPPGVSLRDLGSHRLKDLTRPEQVYQLGHPDLPHAFPPLCSLDNPAFPNNLPQQMTSFIGRNKESADVREMVRKSRLLTILGTGGAGKTRLSLQVGADLLDEFGDGVWIAELAAISDPVRVTQAVAESVGVQEEPGKTVTRALLDALRPKRLLLLLDNCEHVLAACAELAAAILQTCPHVSILASSREALGVAGEQTYRIPPLSLPDPRQRQTAESVSQYEATGLFIERAKLVQPGFAVSDASAPAVAAVCFRLDGIPLAIELAAARARSLTVEEINAKLGHRFRLLTGGSRTALPRQQTLRALIDWSYDLLRGPERLLLRRLSVFAGGWTLEAAEAVCAGGDVADWEMLDLLTGLSDKSLVVAEAFGDSTRYRMLETVRQYAGERLAESGEDAPTHGFHRDFFLELAERGEANLRGREMGQWLARLEAEHDNLRAALDWCQADPEGGAQHGLRLTGALWQFWQARGHLAEGLGRLTVALARATDRTAARAGALRGACYLAREQGDLAAAQASGEEALAIFEELGQPWGRAAALLNLGNVSWMRGNFPAARGQLQRSVTLFREADDQNGLARALSNLGVVAANAGDLTGATAFYEQSLEIVQAQGDTANVAANLGNLGMVAYAQGDDATACRRLEESLALLRGISSRSSNLAEGLRMLGAALIRQGDQRGADSSLQEGLRICREIGERRIGASLLEMRARQRLAEHRPADAAWLLGAGAALRDATGATRETPDQPEYDKDLARVRDALGDAFSSCWAAGRATAWEQAIEHAICDLPPD